MRLGREEGGRRGKAGGGEYEGRGEGGQECEGRGRVITSTSQGPHRYSPVELDQLLDQSRPAWHSQAKPVLMGPAE